jgi:hypothetical protein
MTPHRGDQHFLLTRADHLGRTDVPGNIASVFEVEADGRYPVYAAVPPPRSPRTVPSPVVLSVRPVTPVTPPSLPRLRVAQTVPTPPRPVISERYLSDHGYSGVHFSGGRVYDGEGNLIASPGSSPRVNTPINSAPSSPSRSPRSTGRGSSRVPYTILQEPSLSGDRSKRLLFEGSPRMVKPLSGRKEDLRLFRTVLQRSRQLEEKRSRDP